MRFAIAIAAAVVVATAARAGEVSVAVAASFSAPMRQIAVDFERQTGHRVQVSLGSTGKFYAQIRNGAPFDVLLAADDETPRRLVREGFAVASSQVTYALGRVALWSASPGFVDARGEVLKAGRFRHLVLANPRLAPYGAAATEVLAALGLTDALRAKLVQAENASQAHHFVASGNAELGFVALSQVMKEGRIVAGSAWVVPEALHQPIRQDAVLLERGKGNLAATALMRFIQGDGARGVIKSFGYDL